MKLLTWLALIALAALLIALAVYMANDCTTGIKIGGMLVGGCK